MSLGRSVAAAVVGALALSSPGRAQTASLAPGALPSSARAAALVGQMTLDEKVALVTGYFPAFSPKAKAMGAIASAGFVPGIERLGIPAQRATDASLGVANAKNMRRGDTATALPSGLATAATFDPDYARLGGAMVGAEARAKGFNILLAGGVNLTRDPWAGRNFEYLGEDPVLAGQMAGAAIAGVQSNRIVSTVKHFALNAQETGRMVSNARLDPAALHESDLLAFELAIETGRPGAVMCAYNQVNGAYACENDTLINGVLKGTWGFRGWVMSDWGAVHSTKRAALAGLDQESGQELDLLFNGKVFFGDALKASVSAGDVPMARLDDMVERILIGLIDTGAMDAPAAPDAAINLGKHADIAQAVAEAGSVLLKNDDKRLPLAPTTRKILIVGGHADVGVLSGSGSSQVRSHGGTPVEIDLTEGEAAAFATKVWHASSPLRAIQKQFPDTQVNYIDGSDPELAARAARDADAVLVFATQWQTEGQDAESLSLPDGQDALIDAIASANPRAIVVLQVGGPVLMPWIDKVSAVLLAWYPGQRGGEAIAKLLAGQTNPSGRLPITFPQAAAQAPRPSPVGLDLLRRRNAARAAGDKQASIAPFAIDYVEGANVGYRWYELNRQKPLFAFGYGLSYTSFDYRNLRVVGGSSPKVRLEVHNTGAHDGADVPQVYVRATDAQGRPSWRLAGYKRVEIAAGKSARIEISLEARAFSRWREPGRQWQAPQGPIHIAVGRSAGDWVLTGQLPDLAARKPLGPPRSKSDGQAP